VGQTKAVRCRLRRGGLRKREGEGEGEGEGECRLVDRHIKCLQYLLLLLLLPLYLPVGQ
jgi:hypothetical protein